MTEKELVISLIKDGNTDIEITKVVHRSHAYVQTIRSQAGLPSSAVIKKLIDNIDFKDYFKSIYNLDISISEMIKIISNHNLFSRCKFCYNRFREVRNFYSIAPKMPESTYLSEYDRIRGYMVRNTKYMSKRRGIYFDLKYDDFEVPEYCPILEIKLKFLNEDSTGNLLSHASLDRIDNSKGYVKGNVIVISRLANAMKNEANFEQLHLFNKNIIKLINHYEIQGALGSITDVFGEVKLFSKLNLDS